MVNPEDSSGYSTGCPVCCKADDLLRCSGCKVLRYCGRDHQTAHRQAHKFACREVRIARDDLEKAKQALINDPNFKNDNPFVNHVGYFWKIVETRPYMMGLSKLVNALQSIDHKDSVQAELDLCMEMLRLCPSDNMGVRSSVPGVMLRLDKDQECYDFVKWWALASINYDWEDHSRYYNIKNADAFEAIDFMGDNPLGELPHFICLMILKIKLLSELLKLQEMEVTIKQMLGEKLGGGIQNVPIPSEMFRKIVDDYPGIKIHNSIIRSRDDFMKGQGLKDAVWGLKVQIDELYDIIDKANKHFWPAMKDAEKALLTPPSNMFAKGNVEEMRLALNTTWLTWVSVPAAIDFAQMLIKKKEKDSTR
ncbi:hypothetical protein N7478_013036 [Penicillium angulare]|uniref:uncharacterized protein n=1 Tax=Penicillium angulare TaxID=116970 RepID=UPI00253FF345|nr:uncharacterized protein N7478_013036 [Penicillium angulare]KAJ5256932.1 hypothetical protein N7478_013036 [Penicillium angulare]